jgi:hypothetical protein
MRAPRQVRRPTDRSDQEAALPLAPLLALQRAAGNRAVNALISENATHQEAILAPVQRQPPDPRRGGANPGTADPKNLAPRIPFLRPTGLMYQDPAPAPPEHRGGDTWNLEFHMSGKPHAFTGLDDEGVIKKLQGFYFVLLDSMRFGQDAQETWRKEMGAERGTQFAAAVSSLVGRADWPDPGNWLEVDKQIMDAFAMLRESLWAVMAARNQPLDAGARAQAKPLTEERMIEIVAILEKGEVAAAKCWDDWQRFLNKSERGAELTVTGLKVAKVAGAVAITYLTAGAAAEAQLGYWGTATALAGTGGTYAAAQNLAEQGGEMLFGDRDHIDWGSVAKAGAVNAAASFVGGVVGGKFAGILGNSLGKFVGGLSPEVMQTFGIEGAQLLTNGERIFVAWLGNLASSPFQTSTTVLMQSALAHKWTVTSTGDFFDLVLHDMLVNGTIGAFFSFAQARQTASRPPGGGGGTGEGGGGGGEGGGGGGTPPGGRTRLGMGAAGPAGENARPANQTGETITGMGAAGPAVTAGQIRPITDIAEAQAAALRAEANGERFRWPRTPELVKDLWVREAGQNPRKNPPAAWYGPDGLVINGVKVPVEPVTPATRGRTVRGMGVGPPRPTERGMGVARPRPTERGMGVARPGQGAARGAQGRGSATQEIEMPAEYVGRRPLVTEHAELTSPINRDPRNRMSVSGYPGSLPEGYGVFRRPVRLPSGEEVDAAVKIYPADRAERYESEVAGAMAAARTGLGPHFYGRVPIAADPHWTIGRGPDLAFAMEPIEGAFAFPGVEPGEPGYAAAAAESAQAAGRINDHTFQDVRDFAQAILDQGYYYGGSHGGEVQGLVGPGGIWTPIDFQGLHPLPTEPTARAEAVEEQQMWVQDELNNLQRARDEHHGIPDEEPTDPGR